MTADNLLAKLGKYHDVEAFRELNWQGTFQEYLQFVAENPKVMRSSFQRLYDMILSYGIEDFVPVARINYSPAIFVAQADGPFSTLEEMVAYAEENPGDLIYRASLLWRVIYASVHRQTQANNVDFTSVRHEDLSLDPITAFKQLYQAAEVPFTARAETRIRAVCSRMPVCGAISWTAQRWPVRCAHRPRRRWRSRCRR